MKGEAMRILTLVAALSVIVGTPATAQAPTDQHPAPPSMQQMPGPAPEQNVTAIDIVRLEDLPPEVRGVVEAKLRDTSVDDLRELHSSVLSSPVAMTMLAQNGLDISQVVAAAVDPTGTLTLVIQDTA
jgi:hypothetical protein